MAAPDEASGAEPLSAAVPQSNVDPGYSSSETQAMVSPAPMGRTGYFRWTICALLFFATTINYLDRQIIAILKPTLQGELGWNENDYGNIVAAFQIAYAIGLLAVGWVMDRLGSRKGFSLAVVIWSIAAMAHAAVRAVSVRLPFLSLTANISSVQGFGAARVALGLGESANFPATIKTVAEWFPKKERALATGIFNSGTSMGVIAAAFSVPWLTQRFGWHMAFILTGSVGLLWVVVWLALYRRPEQHPLLSARELAHIRSDPPESEAHTPWVTLLPHRQTWAFAVGKFLTDPMWWFYLFWTPDFLKKSFGITLSSVGLPLVAIYLIADAGSVGGGWLSSTLMKRGWSINAARKTAMLICALAVAPIPLASRASNVWYAVLLIGLAAAAHQGFSANIFTTASDMFPRRAVGSMVWIGGMAGAVGGVLMSKVVGYILQLTGSYVTIFFIPALAYLLALLIIHLLAPRLEPAKLEAETPVFMWIRIQWRRLRERLHRMRSRW
jgi:ACS family hexuronate transporter-like MFS transporter